MNDVKQLPQFFVNKSPPNSLTVDLKFLPWLKHKLSLSEKLQQATGEANLKVLDQTWCSSTWWDRQVLQLKPSLLFKREILMSSQGYPCWYARTIIPQHCYELDSNFFNRL